MSTLQTMMQMLNMNPSGSPAPSMMSSGSMQSGSMSSPHMMSQQDVAFSQQNSAMMNFHHHNSPQMCQSPSPDYGYPAGGHMNFPGVNFNPFQFLQMQQPPVVKTDYSYVDVPC